MKKNAGQSIMEYILVVSVVILFLVAFLGPTGPFKRKLEFTLNSSLDFMNSVVQNVSF